MSTEGALAHRELVDQRFGYLGWDGHGNLGDDAIRIAIERALPAAEFTDLPVGMISSMRTLYGPRRRLEGTRALLGGGTVIGRANWRVPIAAALRRCSDSPAIMLGAGVEDPRFGGRRSFSGFGELRRWRGLLRRFDGVTVRGPRSAQLLADVGIDSQVVGDPALLLDPDPVRRGGDLVVSLGFGDDLWGHDQRAVTSAVADACSEAACWGLRPRFVAVNAGDVSAMSSVAGACGLGRQRVDIARTPEAYFAALDGARVVLAQRLHAGVLSACAGVPFVTIEYQPKCGDFAESVGFGDLMMRTDAMVPGRLADLIFDAAGDEIRVARLRNSVHGRRQCLRRALARTTGCASTAA